MKKMLSLFFFLLFCSPLFAAPFHQIVFFGDSLSDNGNIYKLIKVPGSPPYYQGRFSNGPTWAEYVGNYYYNKYYIATLNHSYGGATAILHDPLTDPFIAPMNLETELFSYYANSLSTNKNDVLYVIWIGANDYLYEKTNKIDKLTTAVVEKISWAITSLINHGATHFLILNLPDLASTPYATSIHETDRIHFITTMHNQKLLDKMNELQNHYPTIKFISIDVYNLLNDLILHPEKYSPTIKDLTQPCLIGGIVFNAKLEMSLRENLKKLNIVHPKNLMHYILQSPSMREAYRLSKDPGIKICDNVNEHIFWDDLHPTTQVHQILGNIVVKKLAEEGMG